MTQRKVGFAVRASMDFGNISDAAGQISVDEKFWDAYLKARWDFEKLHDKLWQKIPLRKRVVLQAAMLPNPRSPEFTGPEEAI